MQIGAASVHMYSKADNQLETIFNQTDALPRPRCCEMWTLSLLAMAPQFVITSIRYKQAKANVKCK